MSTECIVPLVALALIVFFLGGGALVLFGLGRAQDAATVEIRKRLQEFAAQTGLVMESSDPRVQYPDVTGRYWGFDVRLHQRRQSHRSGGHSHVHVFTVLSIVLPIQNRLAFSMRKEGLPESAAKSFGAQDVQVGNPWFDGAYFLQCNAPANLTGLLTPELQQAIMHLQSTKPEGIMGYDLVPGRLDWGQQGIDADGAHLKLGLEVAVRLAMQVLAMEAPHLLQQRA